MLFLIAFVATIASAIVRVRFKREMAMLDAEQARLDREIAMAELRIE
ncbi:MAG: hypothetical protein K2X74_18160 [Acetobacteraceae bacterium]|nr:hypothetical protein [Acetobacteraceae bacterium]